MSNSLPRACVIGWPIAHSRSPAIHRFWLNELGLAGDYLPVAVPAEQITSFLQSFPNSGFVGGNVTVPHKEVAFAAVDAYLSEVGEVALTSVGSYQIEGPGIRLFEAIDGDYFAILGLPLLPLLGFLREAGAVR